MQLPCAFITQENDMEALKEKILSEGVAIGKDIIKVDSFLNHQIDAKFLERIGREFAARFSDCRIDRILTVEASGIAVAVGTAVLVAVAVAVGTAVLVAVAVAVGTAVLVAVAVAVGTAVLVAVAVAVGATVAVAVGSLVTADVGVGVATTSTTIPSLQR